MNDKAHNLPFRFKWDQCRKESSAAFLETLRDEGKFRRISSTFWQSDVFSVVCWCLITPKLINTMRYERQKLSYKNVFDWQYFEY